MADKKLYAGFPKGAFEGCKPPEREEPERLDFNYISPKLLERMEENRKKNSKRAPYFARHVS